MCTILQFKHTLSPRLAISERKTSIDVLLCSVNDNIGNILETLSWQTVVTSTNITDLNNLLNSVNNKCVKKLFTLAAT